MADEKSDLETINATLVRIAEAMENLAAAVRATGSPLSRMVPGDPGSPLSDKRLVCRVCGNRFEPKEGARPTLRPVCEPCSRRVMG